MGYQGKYTQVKEAVREIKRLNKEVFMPLDHQAGDLLLWLSQRNDRIKSQGLKEKLMAMSDPFYISRVSSEMMRAGWAIKMSNMDLSEEDIKRWEETVTKMENVHKKRLKEFEVSKIQGKNEF
jgi:hypothetical protein